MTVAPFAKGSLGAAALYYASLGWAVFPLVPRDKIPLLPKARGGRGFEDATTDAAQIIAWWSGQPDANVGIATGTHGPVVVDVDGPQGEASLAAYGVLAPAPEVHTGKGRHLYFAASGEQIRNSAGKLGPKLDIRGVGGYVVAPPSVHPNGSRYAWAMHPGKQALPPFPAPLAARLAGVVGAIVPSDTALRSAVDVVLRGADEGSRNQNLAEVVGRWLALGARELEVLQMARALNAKEFRPPLPDEEVEAVVRSIATTHARNRGTTGRATKPNATPAPMTPITVDVFEAMNTRSLAPVDALPTMLPAWNRACRGYGGGQGWARGWHVVAAGGAGAGKSLLALNLTASALRSGHHVGWISLEMSREQLLLRLLGIDTGRPLHAMEPGPSYDERAFSAAAFEFVQRMEDAGASLWLAERPGRELPTVERLMREAIDAGCRLIVLDYLQLVGVPGVQKRDEAVAQVSAMVQSLAYQHDVNTLALSQFNRNTTANGDAAPTIHGLAGSSSIENDADQIVLIDHTTRQEVAGGRTFNLLLDKNRHGPGATMPVLMDTKTLQIVDRSAPTLARTAA